MPMSWVARAGEVGENARPAQGAGRFAERRDPRLCHAWHRRRRAHVDDRDRNDGPPAVHGAARPASLPIRRWRESLDERCFDQLVQPEPDVQYRHRSDPVCDILRGRLWTRWACARQSIPNLWRRWPCWSRPSRRCPPDLWVDPAGQRPVLADCLSRPVLYTPLPARVGGSIPPLAQTSQRLPPPWPDSVGGRSHACDRGALYAGPKYSNIYSSAAKEGPTRLAALDFASPSGFEWLPFSKLGLQTFVTIRHLQHHTGELGSRLSGRGIEISWVGVVGE